MKLKISKGFIGFISGIVFTLFVGAIVIPNYCDYRERAITYNLLKIVFPNSEIAQRIETSLINNKPIQAQNFSKLDTSFDDKANIQFGYVNELGEVVIKFGGDGQIVFLQPQVVDKQVQWLCVGGISQHMPFDCRTGLDPNNPVSMQRHNQ